MYIIAYVFIHSLIHEENAEVQENTKRCSSSEAIHKESSKVQVKTITSPERENRDEVSPSVSNDWCNYDDEEGDNENYALLHWSNNEMNSSECLTPSFPSYSLSSVNHNKLTIDCEVSVIRSPEVMSIDPDKYVINSSIQKNNLSRNENHCLQNSCEENLLDGPISVGIESIIYEQKRESSIYKQEENIEQTCPVYVFPVYELYPLKSLSSSVCQIAASSDDVNWARSEVSTCICVCTYMSFCLSMDKRMYKIMIIYICKINSTKEMNYVS